MRLGLTLAAMLTSIGTAAADEPRYLPPVGMTATYRVLVTVGTSGHEQTQGQIYRVKITSNDGKIAKGTITPLAVVWQCADSDSSTPCKQARLFPDARREGDLLIAPLPEEISSELGKLGKLVIRDPLHVTQVFPFPGPQEPVDTGKPRFGSTPISIQTSALDCDETALKPFFPFGATARVSVPCKLTVEVAQSRLSGLKDAKSTHDVTYDLSYAGREHIAVPAGAYEVAVIKLKSAPSSGEGAVMEGEWEFVESLGLSARSSALTRFPNSPNTSHIVRELLEVEH